MDLFNSTAIVSKVNELIFVNAKQVDVHLMKKRNLLMMIHHLIIRMAFLAHVLTGHHGSPQDNVLIRLNFTGEPASKMMWNFLILPKITVLVRVNWLKSVTEAIFRT